MQLALFETAIDLLSDTTRSCRRGCAGRDGDDDVRERRPRVIEIVLRRPRRVIGMRVIEPEQLAAELARRAARRAGSPTAARETAAAALPRSCSAARTPRARRRLCRPARRSIRADTSRRRARGSRRRRLMSAVIAIARALLDQLAIGVTDLDRQVQLASSPARSWRDRRPRRPRTVPAPGISSRRPAPDRRSRH